MLNLFRRQRLKSTAHLWECWRLAKTILVDVRRSDPDSRSGHVAGRVSMPLSRFPGERASGGRQPIISLRRGSPFGDGARQGGGGAARHRHPSLAGSMGLLARLATRSLTGIDVRPSPCCLTALLSAALFAASLSLAGCWRRDDCIHRKSAAVTGERLALQPVTITDWKVVARW